MGRTVFRLVLGYAANEICIACMSHSGVWSLEECKLAKRVRAVLTATKDNKSQQDGHPIVTPYNPDYLPCTMWVGPLAPTIQWKL